MAVNYPPRETTSIIRAALKKQWPKIKFWVRMGWYSGGGGAYINVYWDDHQALGQVELNQFLDQFRCCHFDGLTDSSEWKSVAYCGEETMFDVRHISACIGRPQGAKS